MWCLERDGRLTDRMRSSDLARCNRVKCGKRCKYTRVHPAACTCGLYASRAILSIIIPGVGGGGGAAAFFKNTATAAALSAPCHLRVPDACTDAARPPPETRRHPTRRPRQRRSGLVVDTRHVRPRTGCTLFTVISPPPQPPPQPQPPSPHRCFFRSINYNG